jgi:hypothetical protein
MNLLPRRKSSLPKDPDLEKAQQDLADTQRRLENLKATVRVWKRGGTTTDGNAR